MTTTKDKKSNKALTEFIARYGGYETYDGASDFVSEVPHTAYDFAYKIKESYNNDKTLSEKLKAEVLSRFKKIKVANLT